MSSLQRVLPWQEHQHLSSPLEGVGILVFVKMVGNMGARESMIPTDGTEAQPWRDTPATPKTGVTG